MTGWLFHSAWSPALVLLAGLATAAGLTGVGLLALEVVGLALPSPWRVPAGILLGVEMLALDVQLLGWTHVSTRPVLEAGWWLYVAVGLLYLWSDRPRERPRRHWRWQSLLAIPALATLTTLLVATAPSTKIDEIFYHMLLPSRVITDGALRFYRYPWEGAAWPQMLYQLAAAPLHALGVPDAPNVVSWCLSLVLMAFAWRVVTQADATSPLAPPTAPLSAVRVRSYPQSAVRSESESLLRSPSAVRSESESLVRSTVVAVLLLIALSVGTYPPVWWTTAGPHAMGDLALACAIVAVCSPDLLRGRVPARTYVAAVSLFALAAATTKISLLPVTIGVTIVALVQAMRDDASAARAKLIAAAVGPWLVFYVPVVLATWIESGAPFGPFEAWLFPLTVYEPAHIHRVLDLVRRAGQTPFTSVPWELFTRRTPLLWIATVAAPFATTLPLRRRAIAAAIFATQIALVAELLPWDPRFLSGIPIALAILLARYPRPRLAAWLTRRAVAAVLVVFLALPWLGAELWYSTPFLRVSTGLMTADAFRARYVPFWRDLAPLDSLLPRNAVLLVDGYRLGAVYAPRAIVWTAADIVGRPPVYELGPTCTVTNSAFVPGAVSYRDSAAVIEAPRDPRRSRVLGPLCVRALGWRNADGTTPSVR